MEDKKDAKEKEDLKDLDPEKDPQGGTFHMQHDEYDPGTGRGVKPKLDK